MSTLKIRITDATILGGQPVEVGSVHEVEKGEALIVIGAGRAVEVPAEEKQKAEAPREVEAAAPAPAVEVPAPVRAVEKKKR